jgi:hypothetical protein
MRTTVTGLVFALAASVLPANASSPAPSDLALSMRVLAASPSALVPGTRGLVELAVHNRGPRDVEFHIHTGRSPFSLQSQPPFDLFTPAQRPDACDVQIATGTGASGEPAIYWFIPGDGVSVRQSRTCVVGFEILPGATRPLSLTFEVSARSGTSLILYDLTPDDNIAHLPFGTAALPVPTGPLAPWLGLTILLLIIGSRRLRSRKARALR